MENKKIQGNTKHTKSLFQALLKPIDVEIFKKKFLCKIGFAQMPFMIGQLH